MMKDSGRESRCEESVSSHLVLSQWSEWRDSTWNEETIPVNRPQKLVRSITFRVVSKVSRSLSGFNGLFQDRQCESMWFWECQFLVLAAAASRFHLDYRKTWRERWQVETRNARFSKEEKRGIDATSPCTFIQDNEITGRLLAQRLRIVRTARQWNCTPRILNGGEWLARQGS